MIKTGRALFAIVFLGALAGCSKSPPNCSDEETLTLVRKILLEQIGGGASDEEIRNGLTFEFARASSSDEKIKKLTCEAKLVSGGSYQLPITYESQLDDNGQHIVSVGGISTIDLIGVKTAFEAQVKKPSPGGSGASSAQAITEQDVSTLGSKPTPQAPESSGNVTGRWKGKLEGDGEMEISKSGSGYNVSLGVTSSDGCSGEIEGEASLAGDVLTLTKVEDGVTCIITAKFQGSSAEIEEDGCSVYHGAACGFFGTLKKSK